MTLEQEHWSVNLQTLQLKFIQETCSEEGYDVALLASDCSPEQNVACFFHE